MDNFQEYWMKHFGKDIQETSNLVNACRYVFNDVSSIYNKRLIEAEELLTEAQEEFVSMHVPIWRKIRLYFENHDITDPRINKKYKESK